MKFILDNIFLIAIALVSGGLLLWPLLKKGGGSTAVSPLEATQLINHRNAIVVDVRDEKDYAAGSLAGARNLPFSALDTRAGEFARFKSRPVVIVCDAGQRSAGAIAKFKAQGFEEAYALAGGVSAWKAASLPLVQPGRDNAKVAVKDQSRRTRNENRQRSAKAARDLPVVPAAAEASANDPVAAVAAVEPVVAPDAAASAPVPDRLKELP